MPNPGTFKIKADFISEKSVTNGWVGMPYWGVNYDPVPASDAQCIEAANGLRNQSPDFITANPISGGIAKMRFRGQFFLDDDIISTSFSNLPVGFSITGARVVWTSDQYDFPYNGAFVDDHNLLLEFGDVSERSNPIITVNGVGIYEHPLDASNDQLSVLHLYNNGFGFQVLAAPDGLEYGISFELQSIEIQGEYKIKSPIINFTTTSQP